MDEGVRYVERVIDTWERFFRVSKRIVYFTILLKIDRLGVQRDGNDVVFVEVSNPPLWNLVLDFVLDSVFGGASGESVGDRLAMEVIKLRVELDDHLLDLLVLVRLCCLLRS